MYSRDKAIGTTLMCLLKGVSKMSSYLAPAVGHPNVLYAKLRTGLRTPAAQVLLANGRCVCHGFLRAATGDYYEYLETERH